MAKRTVCLALPLALGALPAALSFSPGASGADVISHRSYRSPYPNLPDPELGYSTGAGAESIGQRSSQLRHPNFPYRTLEYRNLEDNGGACTTKAGGSLLDELSAAHGFTPLERVFLTLSGCVQTAFSSFYLQEVEYSADMKLADITPGDLGGGRIPVAVLDRDVRMKVGGLDCLRSTKKVKIYDEDLYADYTSRTLGLDQLLSMYNIRPKFTLHDAGRNADGGIWRFYTLEGQQGRVDFDILEEFERDAFDLPLTYRRRVESQIRNPNHPDRMLKRVNDDVDIVRNDLTTMNAGGNLIHYLSDKYNLSPLERVAITSNGALQMLFSSFYLGRVNVSTVRNREIDIPEQERYSPNPPIAVFDREVLQTISGCLFCKATSIVRVYDEAVLEAYRSMGIGNLLRELDLNPKNTLSDAGRSDDGGMWRFYTMACKDVIEFDILEEIPAGAWNLPCMPDRDRAAALGAGPMDMLDRAATLEAAPIDKLDQAAMHETGPMDKLLHAWGSLPL